jgi:hypothetical protein
VPGGAGRVADATLVTRGTSSKALRGPRTFVVARAFELSVRASAPAGAAVAADGDPIRGTGVPLATAVA